MVKKFAYSLILTLTMMSILACPTVEEEFNKAVVTILNMGLETISITAEPESSAGPQFDHFTQEIEPGDSKDWNLTWDTSEETCTCYFYASREGVLEPMVKRYSGVKKNAKLEWPVTYDSTPDTTPNIDSNDQTMDIYLGTEGKKR